MMEKHFSGNSDSPFIPMRNIRKFSHRTGIHGFPLLFRMMMIRT
jgi:hypothetical protein